MKHETKVLLQQAHRALDAARRDLAAQDPDNAIPRAYYATFHAVSAALNEAGLSARSHKGTHHLFYQEYVDSGRIDTQYMQILVYLFRSRQDADYTSGATFSLKAATDAVQQAEAFVDAVAALLSP